MNKGTASLSLDESACMDTDAWDEAIAYLLDSGMKIRLIPGRTATIPVHDGLKQHNFHLDYLTTPCEFARVTLEIMATALSTHSVGHAYLINYTVRHAFNKGIFSFERPVSMQDVLAWSDRTKMSYWPYMKFFLGRLADIRSKDFVSDEVRLFLKQPNAFAKRNKGKYLPLVTNDPETGALTEQEMDDICTKLNHGHSNGNISLFEYAFTWFLIATGVRPAQMARMKVGDVLIGKGENGSKRFILRIPLVKGKQSSKVDYSLRTAPRILADVLDCYLSSIGTCDPGVPLFVSYNDQVGRVLSRIFKKLDTFSHRLDGPIPISPYRFRRTIGTRMVALNRPDPEIAWMLTHRKTSSIPHYRAALPGLQEPVKQKLSGVMNVIASPFLGRVIRDTGEATFAEESSKLIRDFGKLNGASLGACGSGKECGLNVPRACLGCKFFEPLMDGPWSLCDADLQQEINEETSQEHKKILIRQQDRVREIQKACDAKRRQIQEDKT